MNLVGFTIDAVRGLIYGQKGKPVGSTTTRGYVRFQLPRPQGGTAYNHRAIWEHVNGPVPNGLELNHIDGDKLNNRISNLELVTCSENNKHAFRIGLKSHVGEKHPLATINGGTVRQIRRLLHEGLSGMAIGRRLGIRYQTVYHVKSGRAWSHVPHEDKPDANQ